LIADKNYPGRALAGKNIFISRGGIPSENVVSRLYAGGFCLTVAG